VGSQDYVDSNLRISLKKPVSYTGTRHSQEGYIVPEQVHGYPLINLGIGCGGNNGTG
jgi:hypothetical protein